MSVAVKLCECGCGEPAPIAKMTNSRLGHVKGQAVRFVCGHGGVKHRGPQYVIVDAGYTTPCWLWRRNKNSQGYGMVTPPGGSAQDLAHRVFYEEARGHIPDGLTLDHLCRNPACVNPDHLEPVTQAENAQRGAKTKLTPSAVRAIRASTDPLRLLAARYGVNERTVAAARCGTTWGNIV